MRWGNLFAAIGLMAIIQGCAGRDANPVQISQPQDNTAKCDQLKAEIDANNQQLKALANEHGLKMAQNAAAGVAGVFTLGLTWFALDTKGSAKAEADALENRNKYLVALVASRCAGPPTG